MIPTKSKLKGRSQDASPSARSASRGEAGTTSRPQRGAKAGRRRAEGTGGGRQQIVIVGGGIAGLYCAQQLAEHDAGDITVLERLSDFGGRIETGDLRGFVGHTLATRPVFKAEFGPMRFELDIQPLFHSLCNGLGVKFSQFTAPSSPGSPVGYPLKPPECGVDGKTPLNPLELLKLGVFKMFGKSTKVVDGDKGDEVVLKSGHDDAGWLKRLRDEAPSGDPSGFEYLRSTSRCVATDQFLYEMGFWNALDKVLSPLALRKIKEEGTFYHLIPQNPNAVEWAIFWLRLFQLKGPLDTIPGGVRTVTERLQTELETKWKACVTLHLNHRVTAVRVFPPDGERLKVEYAEPESHTRAITADHVILALPRAPIIELELDLQAEIGRDLESVVGFTLLKAFLCGRVPEWWPQSGQPDPQERAWEMPTREVHYFRDSEGLNAMTLLYMDEPASRFWAHYVQAPDDHDHAEYGRNPRLLSELINAVVEQQRDVADSLIPKPKPVKQSRVDARDPAASLLLKLIERLGPHQSFDRLSGSPFDAYWRLSQSAKELLRDTDRVRPTFDDVSDYAIRDWSAMPFGAGCHAWCPGARSWEVRPRLRAFRLRTGSGQENVHICGEAYSDYQGFIEGALRSAEDAVATVLGNTPRNSGAVV